MIINRDINELYKNCKHFWLFYTWQEATAKDLELRESGKVSLMENAPENRIVVFEFDKKI